MSEPCYFCKKAVNPYDQSTWKQVTSWVGGPKKDHAVGRNNTGFFAHESCILEAVRERVMPDQQSLFDGPVKPGGIRTPTRPIRPSSEDLPYGPADS